MDIEFDPVKDKINLDKHGLSLANASRFDWDTAVIREDARKPYGERRFEATGYLDDRLRVMIYCLRQGAIRVISLRRANPREEKRYAKT